MSYRTNSRFIPNISTPEQPELESHAKIRLLIDCRQDINKFAELITITNGRGNCKFNPTAYQHKLLQQLSDPTIEEGTIVPLDLGTRQAGTTTAIAIDVLHKLAFGHNLNLYYVAPNAHMARDFNNLVRRLYYNLPEWMVELLALKWSKCECEMQSNCTKFICMNASSVNSFRGHSIHRLYIEDIFSEGTNVELLKCVVPTLHSTRGNVFNFTKTTPRVEEKQQPPTLVIKEIPTEIPNPSLRERLNTTNSGLVKITFKRLINNGS